MARRWRWPPDSARRSADLRLHAARHSSTNSAALAPATAGAALRPRPGHFAIGDVGGHAAVEQHHLLADQRDLATQVGQRIVVQRVAIEGDVAATGA
jgi:hypothetical protein